MAGQGEVEEAVRRKDEGLGDTADAETGGLRGPCSAKGVRKHLKYEWFD